MTKTTTTTAAAAVCAAMLGLATGGCERTAAMTVDTGVALAAASGASGRLVPVTLTDGRAAHLFIPERGSESSRAVLLREADLTSPSVSRAAARLTTARVKPIVKPRVPARAAKKRSWEREVLIVGGSAGAGTLIGALAGGQKGAAVGAAAGGVSGLVYDLATRR